MGRRSAISPALTGGSVSAGAIARKIFNRASMVVFTTNPVKCRIFNAFRYWRDRSVDSGLSPVKNSGVVPGKLSARWGCWLGCRLWVITDSDRVSSGAHIETVGLAIAAVAASSMAGIRCFVAIPLMRRIAGLAGRFPGGKRR